VDDSLRHAISKLAHVHFPATTESAKRIERLGEERWRIHRVGSPGVDAIAAAAASPAAVRRRVPAAKARAFALLVFHPTVADPKVERARSKMLLEAVRASGIDHTVIVYPNNDPGSAGIIRCWEADTEAARDTVLRDAPRGLFLGLMRDAAVIVGNSSSGIIEAASFGTPVIDVGPRQSGRERSENVTNVPFAVAALRRELRRVWNDGRPVRCGRKNVYGGDGAGRRMADELAKLVIDDRLRRKLIAY
jgi:UDP-N-acetylglucosamine 2-epimerase (non-hydrolysing)/GDP/UDP-N,N'-diacetylbacillosamine 2-epimerase (hydrolysing)